MGSCPDTDIDPPLVASLNYDDKGIQQTLMRRQAKYICVNDQLRGHTDRIVALFFFWCFCGPQLCLGL